MEKFTYLALMLGTVVFPLAFSFEKQIHFFSKWKLVLMSGIIPAIVFIVWDILFTNYRIWEFNDAYTIGLKLAGLPLEEWSFFFIVPFSSLFIYEVIKLYLPNLSLRKSIKLFNYSIILLSLVMILLYNDQVYTFYNFLFVIMVSFAAYLIPRFSIYGSYLLLTWMIGLIPMFVVNGFLTSLPVVSYNSLEISGLRLYTIPVEDFFYYYVLLFLNVVLYEYLSHKKSSSIA